MLLFMTEDMLMNVVEYLAKSDCKSLRETCAYVNAETKKKIGYLRLNKKYSREYLKNPAFREEVLRSVANPKKQVSLEIDGLGCSFQKRIQREDVINSVYGLHSYKRFVQQYHDIFVVFEQQYDDIFVLKDIKQEDNEYETLRKGKYDWIIKFYYDDDSD
jgi:hypothetical protein